MSGKEKFAKRVVLTTVGSGQKDVEVEFRIWDGEKYQRQPEIIKTSTT